MHNEKQLIFELEDNYLQNKEKATNVYFCSFVIFKEICIIGDFPAEPSYSHNGQPNGPIGHLL